MADAVGNFASFANDAPNVMITKQMYELSERNLAMGQFAKDYTLDNYMGKTMRIVRYSRINLPRNPLVDGEPPDAVPQGLQYVDITLEQWGIVERLTDVALLTITHPLLQIAIQRCSLAISELMEREIANTLLNSGTDVIYGNSGDTVRSAMVNTGTPKTNRLTTATVINAIVQLRASGAPPFEGDLYGGVIQSQQEGDLLAADATFKDASNFARVRKLENAEIGIWMGVHWIRGNFLPIYVGVAKVDTAATNATKSQATVADTGGALTVGTYLVGVVARDITSDYERKISTMASATSYTVGAVTVGAITVTTPTSVNYTYDIYCTKPGLTVPYKVFSRVAASTVVVITTVPAGTETIMPTAPASGTEVFMAWLMGKDAFARVKLNQMSLKSYITPPGSSFTDPIAQARKVGSKIMFKVGIQDQSFMKRIETVSDYPAFLPA